MQADKETHGMHVKNLTLCVLSNNSSYQRRLGRKIRSLQDKQCYIFKSRISPDITKGRFLLQPVYPETDCMTRAVVQNPKMNATYASEIARQLTDAKWRLEDEQAVGFLEKACLLVNMRYWTTSTVNCKQRMTTSEVVIPMGVLASKRIRTFDFETVDV